jgi:hypothetical protein
MALRNLDVVIQWLTLCAIYGSRVREELMIGPTNAELATDVRLAAESLKELGARRPQVRHQRRLVDSESHYSRITRSHWDVNRPRRRNHLSID